MHRSLFEILSIRYSTNQNSGMATQDDRSLSSGITISKWMKNKMDSKFDFDQSAFSPTELDDSFMFHYFHPKKNESKMIASNLPENINVTVSRSDRNLDIARHPTPCQKYLIEGNYVPPPPQTTPQMKIKSSGTDDGFKGEAAKCGSSIIRVANQMVSGKIVHGFSIKESENCDSTTAAQIPTGGYDIHKRRGSKSLPASPLTSPGSSPKASRRSVNKYFTGTFTDVDRSRGSWILSNLLAKREISQSVGYIGEETREDIERSSSSTSMDELAPKSTVFKAKPSELREMNFWSPTSM